MPVRYGHTGHWTPPLAQTHTQPPPPLLREQHPCQNNRDSPGLTPDTPGVAPEPPGLAPKTRRLALDSAGVAPDEVLFRNFWDRVLFPFTNTPPFQSNSRCYFRQILLLLFIYYFLFVILLFILLLSRGGGYIRRSPRAYPLEVDVADALLKRRTRTHTRGSCPAYSLSPEGTPATPRICFNHKQHWGCHVKQRFVSVGVSGHRRLQPLSLTGEEAMVYSECVLRFRACLALLPPHKNKEISK